MTAVSKVSVIIPLYNRADYIEETVRSVLAQTTPVHELLVIDDGSTDDGPARLEGMAGVTLMRHAGGANKGQAASINLGLAKASGDVVAILDSDDYWHPRFVESLLQRMNGADAPDLVYANGWAVNEHGDVLYPLFRSDHREKGEAEALLLDCYIPSPGCYLCRASLYARVGTLDESLRAAQDHDMLLRLAECGKLAYVNEPLFHYRKHGDSISSTGQERRWRNGFVILAKAQARYPYAASVLRRRRAVLHYRLGRALGKNSRWPASLLHLALAAWLDPRRAWRVLAGQEKRQ